MHFSFVFGDLWLWNAYWPFVSEHFWFYRFWTLSLELEHQESEFSDCDQKFLIVIRIFWLSDLRIFWLWSEFSDCDQNFLIVIQKNVWRWSNWEKNLIEWIFWSQSEFSDCDQIENKTHAYWEINKTERPKTTNKDLKQFCASTDPPVT